MTAIVPAAGQGTRLYPQTHTKPKPMIRLDGKPILGHILESLVDAGLEEVVLIVGSMKDQVIEYASEVYEKGLLAAVFLGSLRIDGFDDVLDQSFLDVLVDDRPRER